MVDPCQAGRIDTMNKNPNLFSLALLIATNEVDPDQMTHGVWTGPISFVPASKSMRVWSPRLGKGLLLITRVYSKLRSEVSRTEFALVRPFPLNISWSGKPMTTGQNTTPCVLWYESGLSCLIPKDIDHCF